MALSAWDKALESVIDPDALKMRWRNRRGYVKEAGGYTVWDECQVIEGRKVVWRAETLAAADEFICQAKQIAKTEGKEQ